MDFKSYTKALLEAYNNEILEGYNNSEILEESIRNNSASNRLKTIISKAEKKAKLATGKEAEDLKKALRTLNKGYEDFYNIENSFKSASREEKASLKKEYDKLRKDYSYQLKKIHMPKGAAAAIISAALAVAGVGVASNAYKHIEANRLERREAIKSANAYHDAQKSFDDAARSTIKRDYLAENEAFRKAEKKNEEYFRRNNVLGFAKKLYKDGAIKSANRKSLESFDFYDFKNALMSACSADNYMTEENGKKFAKKYLKLLEMGAPMSYKDVINTARGFIAGAQLSAYDKMMKEAGRFTF